VKQFATKHPQWTEAQHWTAGLIASALFFGSVVFHELAHSVVAKKYRIPVVSITLFVFGGVARISREAETPRQEFFIAVAGPMSSYFLAAVFYLLARAAPSGSMVGAMAEWLWLINFVLATFNLVPGFPLDGGRILRAAAWAATGSFTRASQVASRGGQAFALLLVLLGIWQMMSGSLFDGLWLAFIGWFLMNAAGETFAQVALREQLKGVTAGTVMEHEVPVVRGDASLEEYLEELLRTGRRCHMVVSNGHLQGLMTVHTLAAVPRGEWAATSVQAVMVPRERMRVASPGEPVLGLLERMQEEDLNQLPVIEDDTVTGIISRDDILRVVRTRLELLGLSETHRPAA
jgi:Zn-dependent protease